MYPISLTECVVQLLSLFSLMYLDGETDMFMCVICIVMAIIEGVMESFVRREAIDIVNYRRQWNFMYGNSFDEATKHRLFLMNSHSREIKGNSLVYKCFTAVHSIKTAVYFRELIALIFECQRYSRLGVYCSMFPYSDQVYIKAINEMFGNYGVVNMIHEITKLVCGILSLMNTYRSYEFSEYLRSGLYPYGIPNYIYM